MALDVRKHKVPSGAEAPRRQAILDLGLSIRDVIPVANTTERAQMISDLTAAGVAPSATNPVLVYRADATAGFELEYTINGSTWRVLAATDRSTATSGIITAASGWDIASQQGRKQDGTAYISVLFTRTGGTITVGTNGDITNTQLATLTTAWQRASGANINLSHDGFTGPIASGYINASQQLFIGATVPGATIANGTSVGFNATYNTL